MAILHTEPVELAQLRRVLVADGDPRWQRMLTQIDSEIAREADLASFRRSHGETLVHVARAER